MVGAMFSRMTILKLKTGLTLILIAIPLLCTSNEQLRMNEIQFIGSHNSYKQQMPDLTPVRVNNKAKGEGLGDLNDIITKLNNPDQIDSEGFDNSLDEISFNKIPKEKWLTYGAVI